MVNSGSSANLVGVAALFYKQERPLQRGDEVIVPAISWATTYYPLQQYGLRLRFVDVELRHAEHGRVAARGSADAADAHGRRGQHPRQSGGARRLARILRSRTACTCSRTTASRWARASADGRAARSVTSTRSAPSSRITSRRWRVGCSSRTTTELDHLARSMRNAWLGARSSGRTRRCTRRRADDFFEAYRFILPGYNVRPLETVGAVGIEQLKKLDAHDRDAPRERGAVSVRCSRATSGSSSSGSTGSSSWFSASR